MRLPSHFWLENCVCSHFFFSRTLPAPAPAGDWPAGGGERGGGAPGGGGGAGDGAHGRALAAHQVTLCPIEIISILFVPYFGFSSWQPKGSLKGHLTKFNFEIF